MENPLKNNIHWTHQWRSNEGVELEVKLLLDEVKVQHFRNLNRSIGEVGNWPGCYYDTYFSFWIWKGGHEEILSIVQQLKVFFTKLYGLPPKLDRHYANFLKKFTDSFVYQYDDRSIGHLEYGKFPIELLYDKEGDCECLSFLLASIFAHAGFQVASLGGFTKPNKKGCHGAVGLLIPNVDGDDVLIYNNHRYLYCEAVSNLPVGKCAFNFEIFKKDAFIYEDVTKNKWDGRPNKWSCTNCGKKNEPWISNCNSCQSQAVFTPNQKIGDEAANWDQILIKFIDYMEWAKKVPSIELGWELEKIHSSSIWTYIPKGNKMYFEKVLDLMNTENNESLKNYLSGLRNHFLSAWPHIVASIFCHNPKYGNKRVRIDEPLGWLGMSVFEMDNKILAQFARKILSDTTCKRVKGFSGGSRLAIGRILSSYETRGDMYMTEKRKSIENILVKVVIPQTFTLLGRENGSVASVDLKYKKFI